MQSRLNADAEGQQTPGARARYCCHVGSRTRLRARRFAASCHRRCRCVAWAFAAYSSPSTPQLFVRRRVALRRRPTRACRCTSGWRARRARAPDARRPRPPSFRSAPTPRASTKSPSASRSRCKRARGPTGRSDPLTLALLSHPHSRTPRSLLPSCPPSSSHSPFPSLLFWFRSPSRTVSSPPSCIARNHSRPNRSPRSTQTRSASSSAAAPSRPSRSDSRSPSSTCAPPRYDADARPVLGRRTRCSQTRCRHSAAPHLLSCAAPAQLRCTRSAAAPPLRRSACATVLRA
jgi:hypothetical protein